LPGFSFVLRIPHAINEINHFGNWRFNWLTAKVEAMEKRTEEWLRQSDYDFETAEAMYKSGRYIYAVFMCHLALEKALKGLLHERLREIPPKSHSLVLLLTKLDIRPPESLGKVIVKLSEASIPTRYPENLAKVQRDYSAEVTRELLDRGREVAEWIRKQLLP
jgi:HEPN domain-containing protein